MLNLQSLLIFITVVETNNFTEAAWQLGLSKSTVSKKVIALEKELNVRLIQRSSRSFSVTEEGHILYQRCLRIQQEVDAAQQELSKTQETPKGTLRISAPPLFGNTRLTALLPAFLDKYPDVRIELLLSEQHEDLISEGLDLSIRMGELSDSSLIAQSLGTSKSLLCASPDYLNLKGRPQTPADLESHNYLLWMAPNRAGYKQLQFKQGTKRFSVNIDGNFASSDAMAVREAAVAGAGLTVLPNYAIHQQLRLGTLEILLADFPIHEIPFSVIYPQRKHVPAKVKLFVSYLKSCFDNESLASV